VKKVGRKELELELSKPLKNRSRAARAKPTVQRGRGQKENKIPIRRLHSVEGSENSTHPARSESQKKKKEKILFDQVTKRFNTLEINPLASKEKEQDWMCGKERGKSFQWLELGRTRERRRTGKKGTRRFMGGNKSRKSQKTSTGERGGIHMLGGRNGGGRTKFKRRAGQA